MSTIAGMPAAPYERIVTIPNIVTLTRVATSAAIVACCVYESHPQWIPWTDYRVTVFFLALYGALTDIVDGPLARSLNQETRLGKRFDQFTDKLLSIALMWAIIHQDGWKWYNALVLVAIVMYLVGTSVLRHARLTDDSSKDGKWKTFVQFTAGVTLLGPVIWDPVLLHVLAYVALWYSVWLMWVSWRGYWGEAIANHRARFAKLSSIWTRPP